ncbi:NAD(P)-dependent oxidoreductase [bacterium LRH843]|nr:NAD(P)-dependent oxidoreductase [bacterium LRH843]
MKKIGLIGTGIMGSGMGENLLKAGYSLVVWNRTKEKALPLVEQGAELAENPHEVAIDTDAIITMLSADQQVKDILLGENGIIEHVKPKQLIIDSSTVSPITSRELFVRFNEKGANFLDAPVTGSAPQAKDGALGFIVGGEKEIFDQAQELFNAMGKTSIYMGASGSGATTKLINNVMASLSLLSFTEGLALAKESDLDLEKFIKVISAGGAHNRMVDMKAEKLVTGDYSPQFSTQLMNKDLGLATGLAEELKLPTPALELSKKLFESAIEKGYGEDDISSLFKLYKK